jgi:membrane-bound lytic murein transglycosylase MltF
MPQRSKAWILLVSLAWVMACSGEEPSEAPQPREDPFDHSDAHPLGDHIGERYPASLEQVLERRFLRVLTSRNSFDYFIHAGHHGGYQFEMVRAFTRFLNDTHIKSRKELKIQFELMPVPNDQLIPMLLDGRADMIAARLTVTPERAAQVRFSMTYRKVDELLVTHGGTPPLEHALELAGKPVAVRLSSSYHASLMALNERLTAEGLAPVRVEQVDEALETERILALVAGGHFDYSVADSIVADTAAELYPELRVLHDVKLREGGELAWATHPAASGLADAMNRFLPKYRHGSLLGNVTVKKYFEAHRESRERMNADAETLSPHDDLFRQYAEAFGFDWRLMAAVSYQESRFKQSARNRSGAVGLFQIKPKTAAEPYIDIPEVAGAENAGNNIHAGVKYLAWIKERYFDPISEMRERDRVRMALAAYNAGPRMLINARLRAERLGLDPLRWFRNVELSLLDMRKPEPVKYVSEINQRYVSYVMLGVK